WTACCPRTNARLFRTPWRPGCERPCGPDRRCRTPCRSEPRRDIQNECEQAQDQNHEPDPAGKQDRPPDSTDRPEQEKGLRAALRPPGPDAIAGGPSIDPRI